LFCRDPQYAECDFKHPLLFCGCRWARLVPLQKLLQAKVRPLLVHLLILVKILMHSVVNLPLPGSSQGELWSWTLFFAGVTAVAFGSSYYHLKPNDATLVWDRLPMTIAFTSVMAIFIIERVDDRAGTKSLAPLVIAGALSIMYWRQASPIV
jgi:hypothetical protein